MSIRREPIYLSTEVWRALWLIGKATPSKNDACEVRTKTPDEIADDMLRVAIKEIYPELLEHQKAIDKMERELIKTLGAKP